ncbi:MAG: GlsB/YeaQ/YmgE family stress response membrane protein [Polyangiaceae bacterium]
MTETVDAACCLFGTVAPVLRSAGGTTLASLRAVTVVDFILYLIIAGICGAIARAFAGGTPGGFLISIMVGFLGAFLGVWIARMAHLPRLIVVTVEGHPFPIIWSIIGGIVLVAIVHALLPRRRFLYR